MVRSYYDLHDIIKNSLISVTDAFVSAGPAPADAMPNSLFFDIDKITSDSGEDCTVVIKLKYFPSKGASTENNEILSSVRNLSIGGKSYSAEKYECRFYARHCDITVQYKIPDYYLGYTKPDNDTYMTGVNIRVSIL